MTSTLGSSFLSQSRSTFGCLSGQVIQRQHSGTSVANNDCNNAFEFRTSVLNASRPVHDLLVDNVSLDVLDRREVWLLLFHISGCRIAFGQSLEPAKAILLLACLSLARIEPSSFLVLPSLEIIASKATPRFTATRLLSQPGKERSTLFQLVTRSIHAADSLRKGTNRFLMPRFQQDHNIEQWNSLSPQIYRRSTRNFPRK